MAEAAPTAPDPPPSHAAELPDVLRIFLAAHDSSDEAMSITSCDGAILYANRAAAAALARAPEELIGRSVLELEPGLTRERWQRNLDRLRADGALLARRATPPGVSPRRTIETRARLVVVDGREHVVSTMRDVTAQADAEAALAASEARLRAVLEGSDDAAWEIELATGEIRTCERYAEMLQRQGGEMAADLSVWRARVHPDDLEPAAAALTAHLAGRSAALDVSYRMKLPDGAWRWFRSRGKVVERDALGRPLRLAGTTSDVDVERTTLARKLDDARLHSLERAVNDIEIVLRPTGEIVMVNDRAAEAFGWSREQLCRMHLRDIRAPSPQVDVASELAAVRARGAAVFETLDRRRDGSVFPVETSVRTFEAGHETYLHVLVRDITARKRLEAELHRVLREQATILANATVGIMLVRDRRQVWANQRMADITGHSLDELRDRSTEYLYPSREAFERLGEEAYRVLAAGGTFHAEQPMRRKDGSPFWARLQGRQIEPNDADAGSIWVFEDVTPRIEAELRLRASEEKYATLFQVLPVGVSITDAAGQLVENNVASERLLGLPRAGHLARTIDGAAWTIVRPDLTPMPPEEFASVRALKERRVVEAVEMGVRRPDGETAWLEVTAAPIPVEGFGVAVVYADVTERRRAAEERERLNARLEERVREEVAANRRKDEVLIAQGRQAAMGEMIGNIAHQWRQPLAALGLVLSNLADAADDGPLARATVHQAVADGRRLVERMSTTINDFRDFFLPEKSPSAFSARRQVSGTVALVRASFLHRRIEIVEVGDGDAGDDDPILFGFPNEYSQVVLNLLTNARDAIASHARGEGRVELRFDRDAGFGVLTVRDDGGGIRAEALDRLFDPYFSTKESGTGIGLYMSKTIVERSMKGRISARNVDAGAELRVAIPLAKEPR